MHCLHIFLASIAMTALVIMPVVSAGLAGGWSEEMPAAGDEKVQEVASSIRDDFLEKSGWSTVPEFRVVSFRRQIVGGTNYLFKVKLEDENYVHLRIFVPLPLTNERPKLKGYQLSKKLTDLLETFEANIEQVPKKQMTGGLDEQSEHATAEIQSMVDSVRDDYSRKFGTDPEEFSAISFKRQTVAGTNYFIKVRTNGDEYVHLRIHKPLPNQGEVKLVGIQLKKKLADSIDYFSPNIPASVSRSNSQSRFIMSPLFLIIIAHYIF